MTNARIRPLGAPEKYFSSLSESVYDLSNSSHIVRLLKALCGDSGVGRIRKPMLLGRLQSSLHNTHHYDIDKLFGNPLAFPRIPSESYTQNPETDLIASAEWDVIRVKDAAYRGRIQDYMRAIAFGGTIEGVRLAARSALGTEVAVLEAWRHYKSNGIPEGAAGLGIGRFSEARFNEILVIALTEDLSAEQRRLIYLSTSRLKPQDSVVSVLSLSEAESSLYDVVESGWNPTGTTIAMYGKTLEETISVPSDRRLSGCRFRVTNNTTEDVVAVDTVTDDTQINSRFSTTVNGSSTWFATGYYYGGGPWSSTLRSLLRFNKTKSGSTVLRLYAYQFGASAGGSDITIHRLRRQDWVESEATWVRFRMGWGWGVSGADSSFSDYFAGSSVSYTLPANPVAGWIEIDITDLVGEMTGQIDLRLEGATQNDTDVNYRSREYDGGSLAPHIVTTGSSPKIQTVFVNIEGQALLPKVVMIPEGISDVVVYVPQWLDLPLGVPYTITLQQAIVSGGDEAENYQENNIDLHVDSHEEIPIFVGAYPTGTYEVFGGIDPRTEGDDRISLFGIEEAELAVDGASSEGFAVLKKVTGRSDWPFSYDPKKNKWIEANVPHEAPTFAFSGHEEEMFDFTSLVSRAEATSEHVGRYGGDHVRLFPHLETDAATARQVAGNALSRASNRVYSSSYYGHGGVVNDSYIPDYFAYAPKEDERARGGQYWSSDERRAEDSDPESLTFHFSRRVPLNILRMKVCEKPLELLPYWWNEESGDWERFTDNDGLPVSYSYHSWGGVSQVGSSILLEFKVALVETSRVKIEIQRTNIPYTPPNPDSFERIASFFPYSVEVEGVEFLYFIGSVEDYREFVYEDVFGNIVSNEVKEYGCEYADDNEEYSYWLSKANASPNAVEYVYLDLMKDGKPQAIDALWFDPIFGGCQMNLYVSDDEDNSFDDKNWEPLPGVFSLEKGYLKLPLLIHRFMKVEFFGLSSIPYRVVNDGIFVESRVFPPSINDYFEGQPLSIRAMELFQLLLESPESSNSDDLISQNYAIAAGTPDPYLATRLEIERREFMFDTGVSGDFPSLWGGDSFKQDMRYMVADAQSSSGVNDIEYLSSSDLIGLKNIAIEHYSEELVAPRAKARNSSVSHPKFFKSGEHRYEVERVERESKTAYLVGLRGIKALKMPRGKTPEAEGAFLVMVGDDRYIESNEWISSGGGYRFSPDPNNLPSEIQSIDFMLGVNQKSFDFIAKQRVPMQALSSPSNPLENWSEHEAAGEEVVLSPFEFADRGLTLRAERDGGGNFGGIVSEPLLVKTNGVARFDAQIFVQPVVGVEEAIRGDWRISILDDEDSLVKTQLLSPTPGKWEDIGITFRPEPSGTWWDAGYAFRRKIVVTASGFQALGDDTAVFVSGIDFDQLHTNSKARADRKDIRVVFFAGVVAYEIASDITDKDEIWFKLEQPLPVGRSADGTFDDDTGEFFGSYFIYYGNPDPDEPNRALNEAFSEKVLSSSGTPSMDINGGAVFGRDGSDFLSVSSPDEASLVGYGEGFFALTYTPHDDIDVERQIDGRHAVRTLIDYVVREPDSLAWRIRLYIFQNRLCLKVIDRPEVVGGRISRFETTIGCDVTSWVVGTEKQILVRWEGKGTDGGRRRNLEIWVDGAKQDDVLMRYNTQTYNEGVY